ncbi:MAG: hypothetical protein ACSLEM_02145 [Candidatus Malihini olakiniferum]
MHAICELVDALANPLFFVYVITASIVGLPFGALACFALLLSQFMVFNEDSFDN